MSGERKQVFCCGSLKVPGSTARGLLAANFASLAMVISAGFVQAVQG